MSLDDVTIWLEKAMTPARFLHTLGTAAFGVELAQLHQLDTTKVLNAALLHDCAKHYSREQIDSILPHAAQWTDEEDLSFPALLHGPVAAVEAERIFGVDDDEVRRAIAYHSTGCPDPSNTLMALIAADFCEPTRDFPGVEDARDAVRHDLRNGTLRILRSKVDHLRSKGKVPHSRVFKTIQSLEK